MPRLRNGKTYHNYVGKQIIWTCVENPRVPQPFRLQLLCDPSRPHRLCVDEFVRSHFRYRVRNGILKLGQEEYTKTKLVLPPEVICARPNQNSVFGLDSVLPADEPGGLFLQSLDEVLIVP